VKTSVDSQGYRT
jgi:hypothetical protein